MQDENTGEEIRCPHCASTEECSHLLALIDRTFNECSAGYASERYFEFHSLVENAFRDLLQSGAPAECSWRDPKLGELWDYAREAHCDDDEDVLLDPHIMTRLIVRLLADAGGEKVSRPITDGFEAPGLSSAFALFYAKEPARVFDAALLQLKLLLTGDDPSSGPIQKLLSMRLAERVDAVAEEEGPWADISSSDIKSFIDARLSNEPCGLQASGRVLLPESEVSIKAALLGVLQDEDQRTEAEEIIQCESLTEVFWQFVTEDLGWVIHCDVTDSMVSGEWGLKAFVLEGRGYIYHQPDADCTEEAATLPILGAWEPVEDRLAYRSSLLKAYTECWQYVGLPPYVGQWAAGPFDVMLEAVNEVLSVQPDSWPAVFRHLRDHDTRKTSLTKLVQKTSLKMVLQPDEVEEILQPYTSTELLKERPAAEDLSENRKRVLVGAFLCLIDRSSS